MSKCDDCGADTSKKGWSQVPGKGELCDPCHEKWMEEEKIKHEPKVEPRDLIIDAAIQMGADAIRIELGRPSQTARLVKPLPRK